mmetsp:Transcript_7632/g.23920  ORF Transcript_7632/g.23920 Transcript_7632/m.23920 type:complete len:387 (-) Transcript_7632:70-1230(-)
MRGAHALCHVREADLRGAGPARRAVGSFRGPNNARHPAGGRAAKRPLLLWSGENAHLRLLHQRGLHGHANLAADRFALLRLPRLGRGLAGAARRVGGRVQPGGRRRGGLRAGWRGHPPRRGLDALRHRRRRVRHRAADLLPVGVWAGPLHQRADGEEVLPPRLRRHAHHRDAPVARAAEEHARTAQPARGEVDARLARAALRAADDVGPLPVRRPLGAAPPPLPALHAVLARRRARRGLAKGGRAAARGPLHARLQDGGCDQAARRLACARGLLRLVVVEDERRPERLLATPARDPLPRALYDQRRDGGRALVARQVGRRPLHRRRARQEEGLGEGLVEGREESRARREERQRRRQRGAGLRGRVVVSARVLCVRCARCCCASTRR